jgi:hypothetical protein
MGVRRIDGNAEGLEAWAEYTGGMGARAARTTITLVLLTCVICPIVEMFDHWDHTLKTGNDTEYTLVLVALCVGVAHSFERLFSNAVRTRFIAKTAPGPRSRTVCQLSPGTFTLLPFLNLGPPVLELRI